MQIDFFNIDALQKQNWLQGAIAPRPIGLISTIDRDEVPNLAPFSFFNVVSNEPPVLIFSPTRRLYDNTTKHTIENIREVPEAVIHVVSYDMLRQMNLAACDYAETIDEFIKAGFTKEKASHIKPWMIRECPVKIECRIKEMKPLGNKGGAGTVCFAEVICIHVDGKVLDEENNIDPGKLGQIANLGGDRYIKVSKANLFKMPKPGKPAGIGFDKLPVDILKSSILSANHMGQLASVSKIPVINEKFDHIGMQYLLELPVTEKRRQELHTIAARMLDMELIEEAWQVLLRIHTLLLTDEGLIMIDCMD